MYGQILIDWEQQQFIAQRSGIFGATIHTEQPTAILYRHNSGSRWEDHEHSQAQITMVLEGAIDFIVAGEPVHLPPGQLAALLGGTRHSASVTADRAVTLNVLTHRENPPDA